MANTWKRKVSDMAKIMFVKVTVSKQRSFMAQHVEVIEYRE